MVLKVHGYDSLEKVFQGGFKGELKFLQMTRYEKVSKQRKQYGQRPRGKMCPTHGRVLRGQAEEVSRVLKNYSKKSGLYPVGNEEPMKGFKWESGCDMLQ